MKNPPEKARTGSNAVKHIHGDRGRDQYRRSRSKAQVKTWYGMLGVHAHPQLPHLLVQVAPLQPEA